ncbi:hypothetical protein PFISCL1PPCAC_6114 [Pristionchus fissidentatus]|uniref:Edg1 TPR repeats region domain-containing protein n=1 Tax=Pristionchus fissidentatus TaxID=1538716 RepID=A0AAV5V9B2_9BILA|nr:hypothetical protein PFISCL1PPCAC_6114 [Pristionchus fissidentatus]
MSLTSYEEKRLQEIRNFEECLQDGFELYTTGKSAIEYHFGSKKLGQVFEAAFTCDELKNECIDLADRLFFIIERDTMKHIKNQMERGLSRDEARLFVRRMGVFWQIFEMEQVNGLVNEEVKSRMHKLLSEIDQSLIHFKYKAELKNLPSDLIISLESLSVYDRSSPTPQVSRLSQIDSAIYKTDCDTSINDPEEQLSNEFFDHTNTIMDDLLKGEVKVENLKVIHDNDCLLKTSHSTALSTRLFSVWWSLMDSIESRVQEATLRVLRFVFLSGRYRDNMVHQFHEMYLNEKKSLPSFTQSPLLPEGKKVITMVINDIRSHDEMQRNVEKSERVLRQFQWIALISPEEMICSLLQRCFTNRTIVAPSVKLISSLPSLSALCVSSNGLIMGSLISIARSTDYSIGDERDALVYLIASLTRQKKNGSDSPVLSSFKVFKVFVADSIASNNENKMSVALSLLIRLFSTGETKHSLMHFATSIQENKYEEDVEAPHLLLFLLDLMGRSDQEGNKNLFELTKKTIKQMGSKLREDGVIFDEETSDFIQSRLSNHEWFVKVAVTQWFSSVFGDPPRQIPSGLLACLSPEQTHLFEQIIVPYEFSPVECFLRSLYEVCTWDLPFALSFLDLGVTVPPLDDNLANKLSLAIVDVSSSFDSSHWQSLLPFLPLTQRLVNVLDVSIDCRLERINGAIYHSIQSQRALNVIARATKLAFLTNEGDELRDNHWALLQLFCSIAKSHIDGEMESWRKFMRMKARDAFNGVATLPSDSSLEKVSSTEYVVTQCSTLFPLVVSLTHILPKVPPCLQVLLSTVSGYLSEFYTRPVPPFLDCAPTGSVPDTTVYAYSAKADPAAGDYGNQGAKREYSATSHLFGQDRSIGTARMINDPTMSKIIENKLTSREDVRVERNNGYSNQSTTTNSSKKKNNYRRKK